MEVKIKAIHFDITDKLVAFINKKVDTLARRYEAITEVEVTLKVGKPETAMNKEAALKGIVPQSADVFASNVADPWAAALDLGLAGVRPTRNPVIQRKRAPRTIFHQASVLHIRCSRRRDTRRPRPQGMQHRAYGSSRLV